MQFRWIRRSATSAEWRRSTANSTTANSWLSRRSRTPSRKPRGLRTSGLPTVDCVMRPSEGPDWDVPGESISLRDCELPHIAREAFVVKYPRGQDHFRHTNWRTGDGSSPRLETCRNWKNFQRLWATFTTHHSTRRSGREFSADGRAEATAGFTDRFEKGGGEILDIIKVPPNPDFAPFLQRVTE